MQGDTLAVTLPNLVFCYDDVRPARLCLLQASAAADSKGVTSGNTPENTYITVRQLRHRFGPPRRDIWAFYHPAHAMSWALLGYRAYWMLIGACDPML